MKSIKPIALKEAKILSNEEMKHLYGGSGSDSDVSATCNADTNCTVTDGGTSYSGSCIASVSNTTLKCVCKYSSAYLSISGADETNCFIVTAP
jgi:natural product precursor